MHICKFKNYKYTHIYMLDGGMEMPHTKKSEDTVLHTRYGYQQINCG